MQLCINAQLPQTFGGTGGTSIYLDTEGSFVAKRVARIAGARAQEFNQRAETPVTAESLMQGVQYCRVHSPVELIAMIRILHDIVRAHPKTKLIVVDSIAFLFRSNFSDMQMRTKLVATLGRQLASMAREFDIAVVVMNHMTTKIESSQAQKSVRNGDHPPDQVHPALGETWAAVCTHRIRLLSHATGRSARLFKSPSIQERSVPFQIVDEGISDLDDLAFVVPDGLADDDIAFGLDEEDCKLTLSFPSPPLSLNNTNEESSAMPSSNMPVAMTSLTPSVLEVNIRRLMAKCDAKVHGADGILQGSDRTKYLANIKALKEMMIVLEEDLSKSYAHITFSGKGDRAVFAEYTAKIDALATVVEHSASGQGGEQGLGKSAVPLTLTNESSFGMRERRSAPTAERNRDSKAHNDQTLTNNSLRISNSQDSTRNQAQIEAALQNDRAQREEMEAGLSMLMQQLRHNAMAIHQTLADEKSSGLLDDADQALDSNITRLGKERTRLELYSKQSRKTKWIIWGIVLVVSLVFVFMFFIIRIF
ncbi:DNA repair protein rad51c [Mortierella alpina]|nr:DNA repair protein rad51c [Mortierella alpina]